MRSRSWLLVGMAALVSLTALICGPSTHVVHASSSGMVISAVYGGGGGSYKADWLYDYVELFNAGSVPVNLSGWSIQYAAAGQTTWNNSTNLPNVTLLPGQYFLVQEGTSLTGGGAALPFPDFVNSADPRHLSSTSHKVAIFSTTARFDGGANPSGSAHLVDLLGYGISNAFEGSGPAPSLNTEKQAVRKNRGCTDTNTNSSDFEAVDQFRPRNSSSRLRPCGADKQLLKNSDFNGDANGDRIPDRWVLKNRTQDDMICNSSDKSFAFAGKCAFQFVGGSGESATLQQDVSISNLTFATGDRLVLSAYLKAKNSAASVRFIVKVKYAGVSKPAKVMHVIGPVGGYTHVTAPALTLSSADVTRIKVQFKHKSTSGKVLLDGATLMLQQSGSRDSELDLLPVPPAADFGTSEQ